MDRKTIRGMMPQPEKTLFLGKEIEILGEKVLVAAFCLIGHTLKLYLYEEGEDKWESAE